jgi:hypothetical protein
MLAGLDERVSWSRGTPSVASPARGSAWPWAPAPPAGDDGLAALLGRGRAAVLTAIGAPASTTELAARLAVTPGAVSQQLAILTRPGLASRMRRGRRVLHLRTELGDQLAAAGRGGRRP